ncbi:desulfoferrodoxin family protein [Erysipelatoclostridium sp. An15]|uniref:Desulfoferrodoxin n=1 Tax=Candidatus Erysipelatoclostridium merdavium TaxID=2838566 RepID=A0A9D1XKR1_9FIRM|nr:desulfoferrodoxin family protein [Erysipelatoclostridium sp. An15]OUQ05394.1 desulfoferrodoxin [Erysipelatoclostridium sp. An15]HIX81293.1 desulfoferrodoxin [Candidatus Erysipelatoclostridium merdavium]
MKLLKCPICGNVVEMVEDHGVPLMCCGKPMVEVKAGEVDAAVEKHVPVVKVEGDYLVATVGEVLHPMTPEHLISNIWVEFSDGSAMKVTLTPEDKPEARFNIAGKKGKATVYEYCNLHGLWKAEVEL